MGNLSEEVKKLRAKEKADEKKLKAEKDREVNSAINAQKVRRKRQKK